MSQYYIYKLVCDDCDELYVGSTKSINGRKGRHKYNCNNANDVRHNSKLYTIMREYGGWDNWRMVVIEECGNISKTQAHIKEEEYRDKLKAKLNSILAYQTNEQKKEKRTKYRKDKIECDCGCFVIKNHMSDHKKTKKHITLLDKIQSKQRLGEIC